LKKKNSEIIAAIDIGLHSLKMKIARIKNDHSIKTIEDLRYPIPLGIDTFTKGNISYDSVREVCRILKGYHLKLKEYDVEHYRIIGTNAIREAKNRDFIINHIKMITGFDIEILDISMARFLTYKAVRGNLEHFTRIRKEGAFLVGVSAGSSEVSVYKADHLQCSLSIRIGSLRIREMLSDLQKKTIEFYKILEEYVESILEAFHLSQRLDKVNHFIAIGGEIANISRVCNFNQPKRLNKIKRNDFINLYKELVSRSTDYFSLPVENDKHFLNTPEIDLVKKYRIPQDMIDLFLPSVIIYKKFLELSQAKCIELPLISFRDGILQDIMERKFPSSGDNYYTKDIIDSVRYLAERYSCDTKHYEDVTRKVLKLFDSLKKLHCLKRRERLLLEIASILHDCGNYISLTDHYKNSYQIVMSSSLIGITSRELHIIANVAYYHSHVEPSEHDRNFHQLEYGERLIVSKLVSLLKIANALDKSHLQKINDLEIKSIDHYIDCYIKSDKNPYLEEWAFHSRAGYFQKVFGIPVQFKLKRNKRP